MIDTRIVKDYSGVNDLCETFTNDNTKMLLKQGINSRYHSPVRDIIAGFNNGKPYSRFTYIEVDKTEKEIEEEKILAKIKSKE